MFFLVLFGVFLSCHGFLLDGDTQRPTDGTALSDKRYNTLMDLLMEERRSRTKLEAAVTRELLALKQEVAKCQCGSSNIGTHQTNNNNVFGSNETKALKADFSSLQRDYNTLKVQFRELVTNSSAVNVRVHQVEQGLSFIQQPQSIVDFHNETTHLEKALQITNNRLNAVTKDVDARKQDFIALFHRVQETEHLLENKTKSLEVSQNVTTSRLQQAILQETRLVNKTLEARQNEMSTKLEQLTVKSQHDFDKMAKRECDSHMAIKRPRQVALTACLGPDAVTGGINFTDVKTVNGINNLNSIRNSGTFTCEKSGIYLISVFIQTDTKHACFNVNKNNSAMTEGCSSITDTYQTTSVTLIQHLAVNDLISVTVNFRIFSGFYSCLTIVQIQ